MFDIPEAERDLLRDPDKCLALARGELDLATGLGVVAADHSERITKLLGDASTAVVPTVAALLADSSLLGRMQIAQLKAFIVETLNDGPLSVPSAQQDKPGLTRVIVIMLTRLRADPNAYVRKRPHLASLHGWTRHDGTVLEGTDLTAEEMHKLVQVELPTLNAALMHMYCPAELSVVWARAEAVYLGREVRCTKIRMRRGNTTVKDTAGQLRSLSTVKIWYDTGKSQKTKEEYTGTIGFVLKQPGCPAGRLQYAPTTLCGCVNGSIEETDPEVSLMRSMCCSHCCGTLQALQKWQKRCVLQG